jgi:hypothetical protein
MSAVKNENTEGSHMSEETKSARERYIRVAAIDMMSSEGIRNICFTERCEKAVSYRSEIRAKKNPQCSVHLIFRTFCQYTSLIDQGGEENYRLCTCKWTAATWRHHHERKCACEKTMWTYHWREFGGGAKQEPNYTLEKWDTRQHLGNATLSENQPTPHLLPK